MSDNINYYQSIPQLGIQGRMNTPEEFAKIGLPEDLKEKTVLDIGCNIGAFLVESIKRGAQLATGIEVNLDWRLLCTGVLYSLFNDEEYYFNIFESIDDFNKRFNVSYDLVLLLSVSHLVEKPQEVIDFAWKHTNSGGLCIIEINDRLQKEKVKLPEGAVFFGKNKDNRSVWHCRKGL